MVDIIPEMTGLEEPGLALPKLIDNMKEYKHSLPVSNNDYNDTLV